MPRTARERTSTNVYHAVLRGVNKQQIFECSEDYRRFLSILRQQTIGEPETILNPQPAHCVLYAYCLMGNHVHLLIQEKGETIGETMKRISSSYVYYYNHKYGRIGHLFQERFKSQPVDEWPYFVALLRYIHQNPLKARLVSDIAAYPWSSWGEYLGTESSPMCSTQVVLNRTRLADLKELVYAPLTKEAENSLLDVECTPAKTYWSDEEAWEVLSEVSGTTTLSDFQKLSRPFQKHCLWEAHKLGVGPRTLSRLTGVAYSIVQRATSKANEEMFQSNIVGEPSLANEEYYTYLDASSFEQFPDY